MIAGRTPFQRGSVAETLSAILTEHPSLPAMEAAGIGRILKKTLAKDPVERYQHMKDLAIDLREPRDEMTRGKRPLLAGPRRRRLANRSVPPPGVGASGRLRSRS